MKIETKPALVSRGDIKAIKTLNWRSKTGQTIYIEEMIDSHLANSMDFLKRETMFEGKIAEVYKCLKLEQHRRMYAPGGEIEVALIRRKIKLFKDISNNNPEFIFNAHERV